MEHTPTPEQTAIYDFAQNDNRNLIVEALAGSAKTTVLVGIANLLKSTPMLALAFNVRIKKELEDRLPSNCDCLTLNSLGHRAWGSFIGSRAKVDRKKSYNILTECIKARPESEQKILWDEFAETLKVIGQAKTAGYVPVGAVSVGKTLITEDEFFSTRETILEDESEEIINEVLIESIRQSYTGNIDFDDQIYMAACFPVSFPRYPLVLLDEAQDMSPINHKMIEKLNPKRLIAVGDSAQAIYGFRGATSDSMDRLKKKYDMESLPLTISFRCPRSVVKEAHSRCPEMRWPEWASDGEVSLVKEWTASDLPDNAVILCRNNAPLYGIAIKLFQDGRRAEIVGNNISSGLLKVMKSLGKSDISSDLALAALDDWKEAAMKKSRNHSGVYDRYHCMRVFLENADTLHGAIMYMEKIFSQDSSIKLMTGHKSKGLEFPHVYIMDRDLILTEKHQEERNLLYVMQTRATETLTYCTSERYQTDIPEIEKEAVA